LLYYLMAYLIGVWLMFGIAAELWTDNCVKRYSDNYVDRRECKESVIVKSAVLGLVWPVTVFFASSYKVFDNWE
jgi:hypothetical protein